MKPYLLLFFLLCVPLENWSASISGRVTSRLPVDLSQAVVFAAKIAREPVVPPKGPLVLDQIELEFVPHMLPIVIGTTVAFPNSDEVRHRVFSPSPAKRSNLGINPPAWCGPSPLTSPAKYPCCAMSTPRCQPTCWCWIRPILFLLHQDGKYRLGNLPPGKYELTAWHEEFRPVTVMVELQGSDSLQVNLELKQRR